ncbi:MAG: hypothetical protein G01um101418_896 [Parcubacteria group bacterium Gr01-1014_18]|nr:MAG: hypothetical protein Greene041636_935 [Parcubacteria group bacterium Greene0416_36]TSC79792.1 MAG: hypothetical protein G01um101418_896 [Parcubacteria group bacterium Gr01-1014_18]TSC98076.1 MAG: hypothetical protein Greene101420_905 [Parcubacteria group bacterium Greene1014_20]TSD06511.1 MAG: hypothetical protein Greene07142_854 [Parcubacteria group bacterium Greene0714_2]
MPSVIITRYFKKQAKSLNKKFPNLKASLIEILENLNIAQHPHLGQNLYKIRIRTSDIPRGKNKSFRVIALFLCDNDQIIPITLFYKRDRENISKEEAKYHLAETLIELR